MRWLRRRQPEPEVSVDGVLARRIAAQYAISELSPLARYGAAGTVPDAGVALLQEEIEWCRAWPWIEEPHLRDLTWLSNYLDRLPAGSV